MIRIGIWLLDDFFLAVCGKTCLLQHNIGGALKFTFLLKSNRKSILLVMFGSENIFCLCLTFFHPCHSSISSVVLFLICSSSILYFLLPPTPPHAIYEIRFQPRMCPLQFALIQNVAACSTFYVTE